MTATQIKLMRSWIAALRSRRYKQGQGALCQFGPTQRSVCRYCCLGVLCNEIDSKRWEERDFYENSYLYYNDNNLFLPDEYLNKIGLSDDEQAHLARMNDKGKKFHEIADYLEKKYLTKKGK